VRDDQTLGDLGLDSLGLTELALALEDKTGKPVGDGDLRLAMTVAQVRAALAGDPLSPPEAAGEPAAPSEAPAAEQPLWPYRQGRLLRGLSLPLDLLYRGAVTRTTVLGAAHLQALPRPVIFAGTHHSFADVPLVRAGLRRAAGPGWVSRLVVAAYAGGFASAGLYARYAVLAFGLYPLQQYRDRDASLRGLARVAGAGNAILIFPQGMHARPEQERAGDPAVRFRPGVAHLAAALGAPVVPFGLAGTEALVPPFLDEFPGRVIAGIPVSLTRGPLAIAFGAPLTRQPGEAPAAFAARLQRESFALTRAAEAALRRP
jgi:1-acyl-sn-glycerol-3-phosphate acyltransferase